MATKVGEAYVEIYGDLDRRRITSDAENAGRLGGSLFGDAFTKETERSFRAQTAIWDREGTAGGKIFGTGFTREVHRAVSGMDLKVEAAKVKIDVDKSELERALAGLKVDMPNLDVDPRQALANIDRVQGELEQLARTTTDHEIRIEVTRAMAELDKTRESFRRFGVESARSFGESFGQELQVFTKALPVDTYARAIMTPFGVALVALGAPILTTVGATLGTALGGAILGAVGAAGIGAGIALAASDPRIEGAFERMGLSMTTKLAGSVDSIKGQLVGAIDDIEAAFSNIDFQRFFTTLSPIVGMISDSIREIGPTIDDIANKFAFLSVPVGQVAADFIDKLAPAVERFVDKLADHMPAIVSSLELMGNLVIGLVDFFGDLVAESARVYETIALGTAEILDLYADVTSVLPNLSTELGLSSEKARAMADNIRNSGDAAGSLTTSASDLAVNGLGPLGDKALSANQSISELKSGLEDLNKIAINQNEAAEQWEAAWDRIIEAPTKFAGALDIQTEAGRKNRDMLEDLARKSRELAIADIEAGVSVEEATKKHDQRTEALIKENFESGKTREEARRLVEQYGAIPENVRTQLEADGLEDAHAGTVRLIEKYDEVPKNVNTDLTVSNWGETISQLDGVSSAFDNLKGRSELAGSSMRDQSTQTQTSTNMSSTMMQTDLGLLQSKLDSVQIAWGLSWGDIRNKVQEASTHFTTVILPAVGAFFSNLVSGAGNFAIAWGGAWGRIVEAVRGPINTVIGFINTLLAEFKKVASQFGVNIGVGSIPSIGGAGVSPGLGGSGGFRGFNRGGMVPGFGNKDTIPAMLTPGEGVLTKEEVKILGGPKGFMNLRSKLAEVSGYQGGGIVGLDGEQARNAAIIAAVASEMGLPPYAVQIALATAMQESGLRNLSHGDRDSLGLFQQRPSQGWGTPQQIQDPRYSAKKFFEGLMGVQNWQGLPLTVAAQAVQKSAFPDAYAKWAGVGGDVLELLFKPLKDLVARLKGSIPQFGDNPLGHTMKGMAEYLIAAGEKWVMDNFASLAGPISGGGIGFKAMGALIGKLVPGARVSSGHRPGSRGSSGNLDYHHHGRAIDIVPSPGPVANAVVEIVNRMFKPMTKELIHTPAGNKQILNGRSYVFGPDLAASHYDHVHWAMDNAGVMPPGSETLVRNATNQTEYAMTARHFQDFVGDGLSGPGGVVENHVTVILDGEVIDRKITQNDINKSRQEQAGRRL